MPPGGCVTLRPTLLLTMGSGGFRFVTHRSLPRQIWCGLMDGRLTHFAAPLSKLTMYPFRTTKLCTAPTRHAASRNTSTASPTSGRHSIPPASATAPGGAGRILYPATSSRTFTPRSSSLCSYSTTYRARTTIPPLNPGAGDLTVRGDSSPVPPCPPASSSCPTTPLPINFFACSLLMPASTSIISPDPSTISSSFSSSLTIFPLAFVPPTFVAEPTRAAAPPSPSDKSRGSTRSTTDASSQARQIPRPFSSTSTRSPR